MKLKLRDVAHGERIANRAIIMQPKTHHSVQFEITKKTRESLAKWVEMGKVKMDDYLNKSRYQGSPHITTRQYARLLESWVSDIGLDPATYGSHS